MALNGYRSSEDKRTRLLKVSNGFVTTFRIAPQVYEIYRDGELLGEVRKFSSWFVWTATETRRSGRTGGEEPHKTMREAVEVLVTTK